MAQKLHCTASTGEHKQLHVACKLLHSTGGDVHPQCFIRGAPAEAVEAEGALALPLPRIMVSYYTSTVSAAAVSWLASAAAAVQVWLQCEKRHAERQYPGAVVLCLSCARSSSQLSISKLISCTP
jgi:hypothetical protein